MRQLGTLSLIVCLAAASGCNLCCWGKRNSELEGPTDIRKSLYWCFGEDAVFEQPLGPSREDYGLKPTCWREWPDGGPRCFNAGCGPTMSDGIPIDQLPPANSQQQKRGGPGSNSNPFGDDTPSLPTSRSGMSAPMMAPPALPGSRGRGPLLPGSPQNSRPADGEPSANRKRVAPSGAATTRTATGGETIPILGPAPHGLLPKVSPPQSISFPPPSQGSGPTSTARNSSLTITVSPPMDTPAAYLAPPAAPRAVAQAVSQTGQLPTASAPRPASSEETLEGLGRMIDVSTAPETSAPVQAVKRQDPALTPASFRLSTRSSLATGASDPALEKKTLSALGTMISGEEPPDTGR
jgi:hypothetical protein